MPTTTPETTVPDTVVPGTGNFFTGEVSEEMHALTVAYINGLKRHYGGNISFMTLVRGQLFACANFTHGTYISPPQKGRTGEKKGKKTSTPQPSDSNPNSGPSSSPKTKAQRSTGSDLQARPSATKPRLGKFQRGVRKFARTVGSQFKRKPNR